MVAPAVVAALGTAGTMAAKYAGKRLVKYAAKKGKQYVRKKMQSGLGKTAKKIGKKAVYATKVGRAGVSLARKVTNPVNQAKFIANAARGKGFVLPGSKYIGPGNEMNKGKPVDRADANAYQHDVDYDNYLKKGHKARDVYLGWSDADARLLKNTKADTASGLAVNLGMGAKKLLHKTGLTKRIRDTDIPQKASIANQQQTSSKQRFY